MNTIKSPLCFRKQPADRHCCGRRVLKPWCCLSLCRHAATITGYGDTFNCLFVVISPPAPPVFGRQQNAMSLNVKSYLESKHLPVQLAERPCRDLETQTETVRLTTGFPQDIVLYSLRPEISILNCPRSHVKRNLFSVSHIPINWSLII